MDVSSIDGALDRLQEGLTEARAAADAMRDGDYSAIADLNEVVDALAIELAELKSRTGATF